ncbi:MAG: helix-turn-helix domain-containing protein [Halobacteriaceae archaeon]
MIEECLIAEFRVDGDPCPLSEASQQINEPISADPPLFRDDGYTLLRFSTPTAQPLANILDEDNRIRYLHKATANDRINFRCLSKEPCIVHALINEGFMVNTLEYEQGEGRFTGAVVGHDILQSVLNRAGEAGGVSLERVYPLRSSENETIGPEWDLTPAQRKAVERAYNMGYFEVPKQVTASDVASDLEISKSAFLERLRRGQSQIFGKIYD